MNDDYHFFYKGFLSQWARFDIVEDGITYSCCEQYMMAKKAILFKDERCLSMIMNTKKPSEHQKIGRKISNFDLSVWEQFRERIVFKANLLKFTQHNQLGEWLSDTYPKELVEASPIDTVWGIGLSEDQAKITPAHEWKGLNLLGIQLMMVRNCIMNGRFGESTLY